MGKWKHNLLNKILQDIKNVILIYEENIKNSVLPTITKQQIHLPTWNNKSGTYY